MQCQQRLEDGVRSSGTGVLDGVCCHVGAEIRTWVFAVSFLQPPNDLKKKSLAFHPVFLHFKLIKSAACLLIPLALAPFPPCVLTPGGYSQSPQSLADTQHRPGHTPFSQKIFIK